MKKHLYNWYLVSSSGGAPLTLSLDYKHIQRTNANIVITPTVSGTVTSYAWSVRNKAGVLYGLSFSSSPSIDAITTTGFYDLRVWIKTSTVAMILFVYP